MNIESAKKKKSFSYISLVNILIVGSTFCLSPLPILAQSPAVGGKQSGLTSVCMTGTWQGSAQTLSSNRGKQFHIAVAPTDVPTLERKGLSQADCGALNLTSHSHRQRSRGEACLMAAFGNEAVQAQFERALGVRPAVLCASAELAGGPWPERSAPEAAD